MSKRLTGYAAIFDSVSEDLGFRETLAPGAFDRVLREVAIGKQDPLALVEHDRGQLLGRSSAGTLTLAADSRGLKYEVDPLPDTSPARDIWELVAGGNVSRSSFAFAVALDGSGEDWSVSPDGALHRRITEVARLFDVSPVTEPAYRDTSVSARSLEGDGETIRDVVEGERERVNEQVRFRHQLGVAPYVPQEVELWRMRFSLDGGGRMEARTQERAVVEHAALALRGVALSHEATLRRGEVIIGRRLLLDLAAGRRERRTLSATERRCVRAAEAEKRASR